MSQLTTLLKNNIRTSFNLNTYSKNSKKRNSKKKSSLAGPILLGILMLFLAFIYSYSIGVASKLTEYKYTAIYFGTGIGAVFALLMTITKAYTCLFKAKDFDLLVSMPIPTKTILLSKLLCLSIFSYASFAVFFVPAVIVWNILYGFNALICFYGLIMLIFTPMAIITVCSVLSYLVNRALAKFKYQQAVKSVFSIIFFVVYIAAVFGLSFISGSSTGDAENDTEAAIALCKNLSNVFSKVFYPTNFYLDAVNNKPLFFVIFLVASIAIFALFVWYVGKHFVSANLASKQNYTNKNYKYVEQKMNSPFKALVKKELKTLFSSLTYLINSIVGPLMSVIITVALCTTFKNINDPDLASFNSLLPVILVLTSCYSLGLVPSTACSINFEGKRLWILKSAPIKTEDILKAKLMTFMIITTPVIIINGVVMNILIEMNVIIRILVFVIPFILTMFYGLEGLLVNTKSYRLNWNTEAEAIKQGTNTLWSLLVSLILTTILLIPTIILAMFFGSVIGLLFLVVVSAAITIVFYIITMRNGKALFDKIPA